MTIAKFENIRDMKRTVTDSGSFFFSGGAVDYFHSKIEGSLYSGSYFITSEYSDDPADAKYTARYFTEPTTEGGRYEDHNIWEFREYDSVAEARQAIFMFIEGERVKREVATLLRTVGVEYGMDAEGNPALSAEGRELRATLMYNTTAATGGVRIGDERITVREFSSPRGFANYIKSWIVDKGTAPVTESEEN